MKTRTGIIVTLAIVFFAGIVQAGTIFEKVTPDGKETDIGKVKVSEIEDVSAENLVIIRTYKPDFQPVSKMHRLELIDKEIAAKQSELAVLNVLRDKVEIEAKKVVLKVSE